MHYEGTYNLDVDNDIERLRLLLEMQNKTPVSYEVANNVAQSLLSFFEILASDNETRIDNSINQNQEVGLNEPSRQTV